MSTNHKATLISNTVYRAFFQSRRDSKKIIFVNDYLVLPHKGEASDHQEPEVVADPVQSSA